MLTINQCYIDFVDKILKQGKETYKDSNHHLLTAHTSEQHLSQDS